MKIKVGSANPVKIEAAKNAFSHYYKDVQVTGIETKSGVSEMPLSEEETIKGAINRANAVFDGAGDFYVGIEDGVADYGHGMFLVGWAAVLDKNKNQGLGATARLSVPEFLAKNIRKKDFEFNSLLEKATDAKEIGRGIGAVGVVTKGVIKRKDFHETAIVCALSRFINEGLYR